MAVSVWAIVDAAGRPDDEFVAIGSSKSLWIGLIAVLTLLTGILGSIVALVYLFSVRTRMNNVPRGTPAASPGVTVERPWTSFLAWALVGASAAMVVLGALSIGIFFIPVVIIGAVALARRPNSRRGLPGLFAGLGFPLLYIAYLNRGGPGTVCTSFQSSSGSGRSCGQEWSPWLWLAGGLLLAAIGIIAFLRATRSGQGRACLICGQVLHPEATYCSHCGSRTQRVNP